MSIQSFRDLRIWQKAMDVVDLIYKVTEKFPSHENFNLISQLRRAAVSIPSNIAEGFRRKHRKEYRNFLSIALGSSGEVETQIEICKRQNYLNVSDYQLVMTEIEYLCKMIQTLVKKL